MTTKSKVNKLVSEAVQIAGTQKKLADQCGTSQQRIWHWMNSGTLMIPGELAFAIDKATRKKVRKEQLRPDIFG